MGCDVMKRALSIAPNIKHVHADQDYTRKATTFTTPLRKLGLEPHMGLPSDEVNDLKTVKFKHRDGTTETVIEHCGVLYHRFTPQKLFDGPYEKLKPWRWVVHDRYPDGSIRFQCPFCAGNIYNRQISLPKDLKASALYVRVPKNATECCGGTFVAQPEQIPKFQTPDYGSQAHKGLKGVRVPVEGAFGNIKSEGASSPQRLSSQGG